MYHKMVLKRLIFPVSPTVMLTAVAVAANEGKDEEKKSLVRPRDLPIYAKPSQQADVEEKEPKPESSLLSVVRQLREGVWFMSDQLNQVRDQLNHVVETGKAHTSSSIEILRDKDNSVHRYGAITAGGLLGYLLGIRRGWCRRLVYTSVGATAAAAVCYPEEAKEYSREGFRYTKRYIIVAYHFINGVLRDYVGVQLPSLPGPLSVGSAQGAEKDASTVPTSAALMPPPASAPSHISSAPMPLPPIDTPSFVSVSKKQD